MRKFTPGQMAKRDALKITRSAIRLRKSIEGDHEINEVLPELEERIDQALVGGKRLSISAGDLFNAAFEGDDVAGSDS